MGVIGGSTAMPDSMKVTYADHEDEQRGQARLASILAEGVCRYLQKRGRLQTAENRDVERDPAITPASHSVTHANSGGYDHQNDLTSDGRRAEMDDTRDNGCPINGLGGP